MPTGPGGSHNTTSSGESKMQSNEDGLLNNSRSSFNWIETGLSVDHGVMKNSCRTVCSGVSKGIENLLVYRRTFPFTLALEWLHQLFRFPLEFGRNWASRSTMVSEERVDFDCWKQYTPQWHSSITHLSIDKVIESASKRRVDPCRMPSSDISQWFIWTSARLDYYPVF